MSSVSTRVMAIGVFLAGVSATLVVVSASRHFGRGKGAERETPQTQTAGSGAATSDLSEEMAALRERLARMEQSERLRGEAGGKILIAAADEAAKGAAQKQLEEKINRYYTPEFEASVFTSYFSTLDETRRAEGVDLAWGHEIQAFVRNSLRETRALSPLSAQSVECGRTLCRMELKSSEPLLKRRALTEFIQKMGPQLPQVSVFVPEGSDRMTAYFARPGADLPAMKSPEELVADLP